MLHRCVCILSILFFFGSMPVYSQEIGRDKPAMLTADDGMNNNPRDSAKSINVDMQLVYGQYGNMLSKINLSQEHEDFVYLLSSYFKRSNDFGFNETTYNNSSFYENKIGFTGNVNLTESWKAILEAEVDNESRGMFDNQVYSREEKDESKLSVKNIYKVSNSFETYLTLGGAQFNHRLRPAGAAERVKNKLNKGTVDVGGEYIWSASNRVRSNAQFGYYEYRDNGPDDFYVNTELVDDFNLTRNIGISLGLNCDINRDDDPLIFPLLGIMLKGFEYTTISLQYRYDVVPFDPEEFYLEQKYINPDFDLPPARVHHGDLRVDVRANDSVNVKLKFEVEHNDNFYNYEEVAGDVLNVDTLRVLIYSIKLDSSFVLFKRILELDLGYEYTRYDAEKNITYRPEHVFKSVIYYRGDKWRFEWSNLVHGKVYTDPETDNRLDGAVVGSLGMQRSIMQSFFAYLKIDNLYNNRYSIRRGYPEPGITFLGGLRILI